MPDFIYLKPKCQEKQDSTCEHDEDVCQNCLEKVQTEESQQKKTPPGRTIAEKRNTVLFGSFVLGLAGFVAFQSGKLLLGLSKNIFKTVMAPARKE